MVRSEGLCTKHRNFAPKFNIFWEKNFFILIVLMQIDNNQPITYVFIWSGINVFDFKSGFRSITLY